MSESLAFLCVLCGQPFLASAKGPVERLCGWDCDVTWDELCARAQAVLEVATPDELHDRAWAAKETDPSELRRKVNRIACNRDQLDAEEEFVDTHRMRP